MTQSATTAPFPMVPRNAYFAALKAQYDATNATLEQTRVLTVAQDAATAEVKALHASLPDTATLKTALDPVAKSIDRLNATVASFDRTEIDYVTALYAAAVETSGVIVADTRAGQWLNAAWSAITKPGHERLTIGDIATLGAKPAAHRKFLKELGESAERYPGLPPRLTPEDLLRFVRLAPGVADAIHVANEHRGGTPDSPAGTTAA